VAAFFRPSSKGASRAKNSGALAIAAARNEVGFIQSYAQGVSLPAGKVWKVGSVSHAGLLGVTPIMQEIEKNKHGLFAKLRSSVRFAMLQM